MLAGCNVLPQPNAPSPGSGGDNGGSNAAFSRKRVVEKVDPNILIAVDRTTCEVGVNKYKNTKVSDNVWCMWKGK
ncbi:MAG TPA: hypothetical protein VM100_13500 [Longimicrobiales bacterium]|nr:hypothetical protein [Longimicrobiales bacterium]